MDITIELGQEPLVRKMTVAFSAEAVDQETDKMIQEKARNERLPGFQPNKPLPYKVAKNYFGKRIRQYVLEDSLQKNFYEAISQKKLKPASQPKINLVSDGQNGNVIFSAEFEVYPDVVIQNLGAIQVEREQSTISEADIDKMIDTLRKQFSEWTEVDRPAAEGDEVNLNFKGEIDGVAFPGGSAEDVPLILGSGQMIPGFESGLVGIQKGEQRDLQVVFPDDYHAKDLAGKAAVFHVEVLKISERHLPAIDMALAEKLGSKDLETLRQDVLANMQREIKFALNERLKTKVLEAIAAQNPFELPLSAIEFERQNMYVEALKRMGLKAEQLKQVPPPPEGLYTEEAKKRLTFGLIVGYFIDQGVVKATEEQVKGMVKHLSSVYEKPEEVLDYYYKNPERLKEVEYMVLEENVIEHIVAQCAVTLKGVSFFDIIQPREQAARP